MKTLDFTICLFVCALLSACGGESNQIVSIASAGSLPDKPQSASLSKTKPGAASRPAWTVAVVDANHNGIHDPVDAFVGSIPGTDAQKSSLARMSTALDRATRTDLAYLVEIQAGVQGLAAATDCLHAQFAPAEAQQNLAAIEKLTLDTGARVRAFNRFKAASTGLSPDSSSGAACAA